jgi:oligosaccharide repeat unit polymerase
VRAVLIGVLAAFGGTMLAVGRQATGDGSVISSVLNQGTILFIDTNLHSWVPVTIPHYRGQTYLDALLRPFGLTSEPAMPDWFVSIYAPGSPSGYGFSLTGEAFLNFGLLGIPLVFFILATVQRRLMNRADRSDFACYMSVAYLSTLLYALRGDFSQIFSTMLYAAALFALLSASRLKMDRVRGGQVLQSPISRDRSTSRKPDRKRAISVRTTSNP